MSEVRFKGERGKRYWVRNRDCIGCRCFTPSVYQHRGAIGLSGSKNSGTSLRCMTNAYHGCPENVQFDKKLAAERRQEGWVNA